MHEHMHARPHARPHPVAILAHGRPPASLALVNNGPEEKPVDQARTDPFNYDKYLSVTAEYVVQFEAMIKRVLENPHQEQHPSARCTDDCGGGACRCLQPERLRSVHGAWRVLQRRVQLVPQ